MSQEAQQVPPKRAAPPPKRRLSVRDAAPGWQPPPRRPPTLDRSTIGADHVAAPIRMGRSGLAGHKSIAPIHIDEACTQARIKPRKVRALRRAAEALHAAADLTAARTAINDLLDEASRLRAVSPFKKSGGPQRKVLEGWWLSAALIKDLIDRGITAQAVPGGLAKARAAQSVHSDATELATPLSSAGIVKDLLSGDVQGFVRQGQNLGTSTTSAGGEALLRDQFTSLDQIRVHADVPQVLKDSITEALSHQSKIRLNLAIGSPGATIDPAQGSETKYRIDVSGYQLGAAMRLGELLHEMTHVATQEAYANTPMHLSIRRGATEGEVKARAKARAAESDELRRIAEGMGQAGSFYKGRADYGQGRMGKLTAYTNVFERKGWATPAEVARARRVITWTGANSDTLVEWDTTCTQALLVCVMEGVAETDPLYVQLLKMTQMAYDDRKEARDNSWADPTVDPDPGVTRGRSKSVSI